MTDEPRTFPDVEKLVRAYLADQFAEFDPDVTVGVGVPTDWTPESPAHVQVASDGIFSIVHRILAHATIRLVAWSSSTSISKELAGVALGLLCAHPSGGGIVVARPTTGPLPARDEANRAELAAVTARVTVRSIPV